MNKDRLAYGDSSSICRFMLNSVNRRAARAAYDDREAGAISPSSLGRLPSMPTKTPISSRARRSCRYRFMTSSGTSPPALKEKGGGRKECVRRRRTINLLLKISIKVHNSSYSNVLISSTVIHGAFLQRAISSSIREGLINWRQVDAAEGNKCGHV